MALSPQFIQQFIKYFDLCQSDILKMLSIVQFAFPLWMKLRILYLRATWLLSELPLNILCSLVYWVVGLSHNQGLLFFKRKLVLRTWCLANIFSTFIRAPTWFILVFATHKLSFLIQINNSFPYGFWALVKHSKRNSHTLLIVVQAGTITFKKCLARYIKTKHTYIRCPAVPLNVNRKWVMSTDHVQECS